jgi:predicted transposase/invertase (TIGR01784 family)
MDKYLDPKNDIPFKRIFGEHPDLLQSFLNSQMPFKKGQYIKSLEYLTPELVPDNPLKKDSIVDVRCKDNYGRQFIVEMQMYWTGSFKSRMSFNVAKAYSRQLGTGEDYNSLQTIYGLGIINEVFDKKTKDYYHHYKTVNCKNTKDVIKGMEYVLIELPKFQPTTIPEKKMAVLWLRFLNEIKEGVYLQPASELFENEYIARAINMCREGVFTTAELAAYDRHWDIIRRERSIIKDGFKKGESKGEAKGERRAKEDVVVKSFKNDFSIEIISSITDLSKSEIISILKKRGLMS